MMIEVQIFDCSVQAPEHGWRAGERTNNNLCEHAVDQGVVEIFAKTASQTTHSLKRILYRAAFTWLEHLRRLMGAGDRPAEALY